MPAPGTPGVLTVRYFAAARAAAGRTEEPVTAPVPLADLLDTLAGRHGEPLARVLKVSSYLVDGLACHDRAVTLPPGSTVDILPPFAGG